MVMNETEQIVSNKGRAKLLGHFENGSPEWLEARAGIGGSDIGTILGVNNFKTRADLIAERLDPNTEPLVPNLPMKLGTAFEDPIRQVWANENKSWLSVVETGTWQSCINPFWKANPDGFIVWNDGEIGILEIKFSQARELPASWVFQVRWYLFNLELDRGIIVQCSGNKLLEHVITISEADKSLMIEAALKFEDEVKNGVQS